MIKNITEFEKSESDWFYFPDSFLFSVTLMLDEPFN